MPKKKSQKNYIDNEKFYNELKKYITAVKEADRIGKSKPLVNDYIGECFWKIAENLSHLHKFQKYPYRDEMCSDAIINCLQYIDNFDPEKSANPFAYFTQISFYAFIRRIEKEKKYLYTKFKSIENMEIFHTSDDDTKTAFTSGYSEGAKENMTDFVEKFETSMEKKKAKTKIIKEK